MRFLRYLPSALIVIAFGAHAATTNLSDLWFDPAESGWGASIVQQDDVAFVMLYVYGPNREPTWYFASDARAFAYSADGLPHFRGTLHRARGPHFTGAFDPSTVELAEAGEVTIESLTASRLRLTYQVGGTEIVKTVMRLTWRLPTSYAAFDGRFIVQRIGPGGGAGERLAISAFSTLAIDPPLATLTVHDMQGRCDYVGPYEQAGRLGSFAGTFHCEDGRSGTVQVREIELTSLGISAKIQATWSGGSISGRFAGPRY